ncbi:bck1-like resistance to osmotic shock [Malassezia cuniculi]|uniref:BRO domain-containing protein 1 n=1 Tax=Malassezia cuniculi TaxID=948313 RepID=A0AAF0EWW5_9BASI|nr:bck1-like resistance to osmotic shock [Malassezia cuniculi]
MQPLIALPPKRSKDVDLAPVLGRAIVANYEQRQDMYKDDIQAVVQARRDAACNDSSATTGRDLLLRWFHMLEMLELRFPELRQNFTWSDAFSNSNVSQETFAYEKASVAYNIAARLSAVAAAAARDGGADAFRVCYASLRQAAGMLDYVRDNFLHAPTHDMGEEVTKTLSALCLAQASEVFVEKSIADSKGAALVSKLAAHTAAAYTGLVDPLTNSDGPLAPLPVINVVRCKAAYYGSVAQMYRATADNAAGKYGVALARLQLAVSLGKEAQRHAATQMYGSVAHAMLQSDIFTVLTAATLNQVDLAKAKQQEAQRDNDMVYHDLIPPAGSLPQLERTSVATPVPIRETFSLPDVQRVLGTEVFAQLVPLRVTENASVYSEEQAKLLRAESAAVENADAELVSSLDALGLPVSLARYRALDSVDTASAALSEAPQDVSRWVHDCAGGPDAASIDASLARFDTARTSLGTRIEKALADLAAEDRECERLRVAHGHKWTQEPLSSAAKILRKDLRANADALNEAAVIDDRTAALWKSVREDAALLFRGEAAVRHAFRSAVASAQKENLLDLDDTESPATADARALFHSATAQLAALQRMPAERAAMLAELKRRIRSDDISRTLLLQGKTPDTDSLIANELAKHAPLQRKLRTAIAAQEERVRTLAQALRTLDTHPGTSSLRSSWSTRSAARKVLIDRLHKAARGITQVRETVGKAQDFYSDVDEVVASLSTSTANFIADRRAQRESLAASLNTPDSLQDDLAALSMSHPSSWQAAPSGSYTPQTPSAWPTPPAPYSSQFAPALPPKPPQNMY